MELAATLFTTLFSGGASVYAAAGPWGAGMATAGSTALGALQTAGTVFGALSAIGGGIAAHAEGQAAAREQEFQARQEFIEGRETSAALKQELLATISNQAVAFAAGGASLGSVSVQQARRQAIEDAEAELSINSSTALTRSLQRRRAAANARRRGPAGLVQGFLGAGQTVAQGAMDRARIG